MSRLDRFAISLIGVALAFVSLISHAPFSIGLLIGAAIMAVCGWRTKQGDLVAAAAFLPGFGLLAWWANWLVYLITPHTIDLTLLRIDVGSGVAVWHWTQTRPAIMAFLSIIYFGLGVAAGISICSSDKRFELYRACIIAAIAAPLFYIAFPATGPAHIGHAAARNCIPSLHFTWALLLYLYCSRSLKPAMFAFVMLTAWATMGLGEHYAVDLVVALPFTVAVCALARRIPALRGAATECKEGSPSPASSSIVQS